MLELQTSARIERAVVSAEVQSGELLTVSTGPRSVARVSDELAMNGQYARHVYGARSSRFLNAFRGPPSSESIMFGAADDPRGYTSPRDATAIRRLPRTGLMNRNPGPRYRDQDLLDAVAFTAEKPPLGDVRQKINSSAHASVVGAQARMIDMLVGAR
jgi:hypothetical protein